MPDGSPTSAGQLNAAGDTRLATLDNGLTVIVREDHSAPVASVQAWAKTGSIHEGAWLGAGLSHILEHMLFKGTETRGVGRIDLEVQEAGGYMNASEQHRLNFMLVTFVPQSIRCGTGEGCRGLVA